MDGCLAVTVSQHQAFHFGSSVDVSFACWHISTFVGGIESDDVILEGKHVDVASAGYRTVRTEQIVVGYRVGRRGLLHVEFFSSSALQQYCTSLRDGVALFVESHIIALDDS